jgi:CheY-like chemotaxis protein
LHSSNFQILLVDDDDLARKLVHRVLVRLGFTVFATANASQAHAWLAQHEGALDLLITDINLQDGSGAALAAKLRALRGDLPVLYISGYPASPLAEEHSAFLGKPFTPDELAQAVRGLLGESPAS